MTEYKKENRKTYRQIKYHEHKEKFIKKFGEEEWSKMNYGKLKSWIECNRESYNRIQREYRKRKPEAIRRARENWFKKLKADPVRYEEYKKKNREAAKKKLKKLKKIDPDKYEEQKQKARIKARKRYQKIKADPIKYAKYLKQQKKYRKNKNTQ